MEAMQLDGQALNATFEDAPDGVIRVRLGDVTRAFRVLASARGRHVVQEGDARLVVWSVREGEATWVRAAGATGAVQPAERVSRGKRRATGGAITPPMPGVVERVVVGVGDVVAKGATLVVVSAMKMEHALVAPHAGTVREVRVAMGDKVKPGEVLVEIERPEEATDA